MNVVIYARYSSLKQDENTIDAQIRYCTEYCNRNGYTIVNQYIDRATSASTHIEKRTQFMQMIKDSEKHQFNGVVVFKLDRFARNRYDSATYKNRLKKNNVALFSATENISDDKESIILESVLEGMAEYFSKDLAEKVTSGMREIAMRCEFNGGKVPFGYKIVNKHYVINEELQPYVVEAFERYAHGEKITHIADDFNNRHIPTNQGGLWNISSLYNMFNNIRYTGTYVFKDIVIENGIPQIISKELWNKVNDRSKQQYTTVGRSRAKVDYLLSGKLYCAKCGSIMQGECGTSKSGQRYYYYKCATNKNTKQCNMKPIKKEWIEEQVCNSILDVLNPTIINKIADITIQEVNKYNSTHNNIDLLEKQIKETDVKIENLLKALESYQSESIIQRLKSLEKEKKELVKELDVISKDKITLTKDMVLFYFDQLLKQNIKDLTVQRQLVNIMCQKVIVDENNNLDIKYSLEVLQLP